MRPKRVYIVLLGFRSGGTREMVFHRPALAGRYAMQVMSLPTITWFRCYSRPVRPDAERN